MCVPPLPSELSLEDKENVLGRGAFQAEKLACTKVLGQRADPNETTSLGNSKMLHVDEVSELK